MSAPGRMMARPALAVVTAGSSLAGGGERVRCTGDDRWAGDRGGGGGALASMAGVGRCGARGDASPVR